MGARPTGKIPVCTVPHGRLLSEAKLVPGTLKARFVRALPKKLIGDRAYDSDPLDNELASAASTSSHAISRRERSSRRLISDARAPWGHDGGPTGGGVADFSSPLVESSICTPASRGGRSICLIRSVSDG